MPSRLEKARGRFIGRDNELASLGVALSKARIVSIVGPGGVGKTRLAGEYFERADIEPVFIWLDELRSPDEIGSRLVDALGLPVAGEDDLERAAAALSGSRRVVFFDNAEHVLEGVARVAHRLDTQIVVTSRAPLGLSGEHVVVVEPLSSNHALKLFEDRAERLGVDATLDGVDELVAALDALPLAIELAAARSTVLSPRQILARLRDSNRVIGSAGGDRQSTLDDTIRWSWDLLEPAERDIIITISLFDHPVEPGVIESLWPTHDVLAVAAALEAQSWLRVVETPPSSKRWSTLWAMRRFVREQIDDETRTHQLDRLVEWTRLHLEESSSWWAAYLPEALVAARTLQQRGEVVPALTVLGKLFHSAWTGPHLSAVLEH